MYFFMVLNYSREGLVKDSWAIMSVIHMCTIPDKLIKTTLLLANTGGEHVNGLKIFG